MSLILAFTTIYHSDVQASRADTNFATRQKSVLKDTERNAASTCVGTGSCSCLLV